jgi:hypothetical protein
MGRMLTIEQAGDFLGLSPRTVREHCRLGTFPHRQLPGFRRLFVPEDELVAFADGAALEVVRPASGGRIVRPVEGMAA